MSECAEFFFSFVFVSFSLPLVRNVMMTLAFFYGSWKMCDFGASMCGDDAFLWMFFFSV